MNRKKELVEKRLRLHEQMKQITDKAFKENRALSADEEKQWNDMDVDFASVSKEIERVETEEKRDLELALSKATEKGTIQEKPSEEDQKRAYKDAFSAWARFGSEHLTPEQRSVLSTGYVINPNKDGQWESRAQSVGTSTAGGFLVPEGFSGALEASMKAFGGMRQASTVFATDSGNDLPWPTVNDNSNVGELLAENTGAAEQDVTFGQIVFKAYKYSSKLVRVSLELLQDSAFSMDSLLAELFGERIGRITNTHFTTGDNAGKPQGVVTASSAGVTAASATAIAADELISLFHSVDPAYRSGPKVAWMFNDSTLAAIRKLKGSDNNYLWQPGLRAGEPDLLLAKPYFVNQDMASISTGNKTVLFGDFSKYRIRDIRGIAVQRLIERYAELAQVGFIAFSRHDGRMLDAGTDPVKHLVQA